MKTIYKNIRYAFPVLLLMVISPGAGASENLEVTTEVNSRVIRMNMNTPTSETMDVLLFNDRNRMIHQDKIESLSLYDESYDFSDLKDGTYTLVSAVANMRLSRVLEVEGSEVKLADSYYTFQPHFKVVDDRILVHYVVEGNKDIGISIESGSTTLFDAFYGDNERIFAKSFAIDDLSKGSYTLHFVSQGEFYSFDFEVD